MLNTAALSYHVIAGASTVALMDGDAALQVGQREVGSTVAAIHGSEKRKKGGVLRYG